MIIISKTNKTIIQYSFLFFLIFITAYVVSNRLEVELIPKVIEMVDKKFILLGLFIILLYIFFEVFTFEVIIKSMTNIKNKSKSLSFKLATMGFYYNLVTPFASGSQPMQIYALTKYKIDFSKSSAIVTNKTVIFQSIVTIYCGVLLFFNIELLKDEIPVVFMLVITGMLVNISSLVLGIFIIFKPNIAKSCIHFIFEKISKIKVFSNIYTKVEKIDKFIDGYNHSIKMFVKDKKSVFISIVSTFIQLTLYFSISYCVYRAFNLDALEYYKVLTLQVFLYMSVSPIPTPGNIGANEIIFMTIFSNIFPKELIGYAVFGYSIFVYYLLVVLCGIITIHTHYKLSKL